MTESYAAYLRATKGADAEREYLERVERDEADHAAEERISELERRNALLTAVVTAQREYNAAVDNHRGAEEMDHLSSWAANIRLVKARRALDEAEHALADAGFPWQEART